MAVGPVKHKGGETGRDPELRGSGKGRVRSGKSDGYDDDKRTCQVAHCCPFLILGSGGNGEGVLEEG